MPISDEWDSTLSPENPMVMAARIYDNSLKMIERLEIERDKAIDQLATLFDEDVEEETVVVGEYSITMKRGENWTWDSDKLKAMVLSGTVSLPPYVKEKLTIKRTDFVKLDVPTQDKLMDALTRKPRQPTFTIEEVKKSV